MSDFRFYLGTHRPYWLWQVHDVPLFVSHRQLDGNPKRGPRVSRYPRATTPWALDSGGFTELNLYGRWQTTPARYVEAVRRYVAELGNLEWASPQDWMCEPWVVTKTGLSVAEHQARTVENYLVLTDLAPDLPFMPVLQGWELDDYHRHADAYAAAGVDLMAQPVVGIGSVCRRQATAEIAGIFDSLKARGLHMHGFGVKSEGLALYADSVVSADSLAWSYSARKLAHAGVPTTCGRKSCNNCLHYALEWRDHALGVLEGRQMSIAALYGGAA